MDHSFGKRVEKSEMLACLSMNSRGGFIEFARGLMRAQDYVAITNGQLDSRMGC